MKGAKKLHEAQVEYRDSVDLKPCLVCGVKIDKGYYGRHGDSGVCNKECEDIFKKQPKYPGHTEEDYLMRLAEQMDNDH